MKKIYAINGSPRRNANTAIVLEHALKGAAEAGAATELIHLVDLHFGGCLSCFACKLKGGPSYGRCVIKDDLRAFLDKLTDADGLILGSPIYLGGESSLMRAFMERLFFPVIRYDAAGTSLVKKKCPVALVYTMNVSREQMGDFGFEEQFGMSRLLVKMLYGSEAKTLYVCDTKQFDDYSKYDAPRFDPAHKEEVHRQQFPKDCQDAYAMGKAMAQG
ncbi:MAG: flavodoxin family protein [Lentisphaeria bacterium]|jgi:multimeric flavodoxin WrbA